MPKKSWNEAKIVLTLQQQKKQNSINNLKKRKEKSYGKDTSYNED